MPGALAHFLFATRLEEPLDEAFRLGTQGPDPFFFYGMVPWKKRIAAKEIQSLGEEIHRSDFAKQYAAMIFFAQHGASEEERPHLLSYLKGVLAHYALDRTCHPYIFYRSGFDEQGLLTGHYSFAHKEFEALLDLTLSEEFHFSRSPSKAMKISKPLAKSLSLLWSKSGYENIGEETFLCAYQDYLTVENFLQSNTGWKRPIWKALNKEGAMYGFTYPHSAKKEKEKDVLNLSAKEWLDPCTGEKSCATFLDLMEKASEYYLKGLAIIEANLTLDDTQRKLSSWEGSIDHDGSPYGVKKTYYDIHNPF